MARCHVHGRHSMSGAADCKRLDLAGRRGPFREWYCTMNSRHAIAILVMGSLLSVSAQNLSFIRLNQLGFQSRDTKTAVVFGAQPAGAAFEVADADDGKIVWHGETKVIPNAKWGQFHYHAQCDFSGLQKAGHYILRAGAAQSARFAN